MAIAACRAGVIGAFPAANARGAEELEKWLGSIERALSPEDDGRTSRPSVPTSL
jgi:nitronate monooxygenase